MLVSEGQLPVDALNIWLENSQTCEDAFRSARAISSNSSGGVNFTVSQFLNRINKLSALLNIKSNANQNNLPFPQHHKLSRKLPNTSNPTSTISLSKIAIENSVRTSYNHVTKLFNQLKMKEILKNGHVISIEEMSGVISRKLEEFWSTENIIINSQSASLNFESDDGTNFDEHENFTNNYDTDEEFELNDNFDVLIEKIETTANTDDARSQPTGRPRVVIVDENILKVEQFFQQNSTTSIRRAAQILNIKRESLRMIARYFAKLFLYKIQINQA
ncbi:unnamed protein product [Rotaria sp. Silwood1]|nr:unnamed protein product [Rotaria sp. Silwood1]